MRILFLGDLVGRSGREAVLNHLPTLQDRLRPDVIIANVENAAGGFGVTEEICKTLFAAGIHVLTSGNHIWDQSETKSYISREPRLLRPLNYPSTLPGKGLYEHKLPSGKSFIIVNVMGNVFMEHLDSAFPAVGEAIKSYPLSSPQIAGIFVDYHAETTAEKIAFAHYLDGKITCVVGTHTHVPTADACILDGGTGLQSDAGMCGDYNSVIGMRPEEPLNRFLNKVRNKRFEPASGEGTVCGVFVEVGENGLCSSISPLIIGPRLRNHWPEGF